MKSIRLINKLLIDSIWMPKPCLNNVKLGKLKNVRNYWNLR